MPLFLKINGFIILMLALSGCAPVLLGGAAAGAGVSALYDRRDAQTLFDDQQIQFAALGALKQDARIKSQADAISITSYNRTVLLTGQIEAEAVANRAVERIRRLAKVKRVINQLNFGMPLSFARKAEDAYITSRAKLALTQIGLPDFNVTRVKIVTSDGVVYLLGLVRQKEGAAAIEKVRYVPGVLRVVDLFEYQ
ncbi:transporter [Chromatium weissei]|nr:transporter [Chromatium weissei]